MVLITEMTDIIKIGIYFLGQIGCKCNFNGSSFKTVHIAIQWGKNKESVGRSMFLIVHSQEHGKEEYEYKGLIIPR